MHNHTHSHDYSNRDEALALIKYMASHNESHTKELCSLCEEIKKIDEGASELVMSAINEYNKGNELLNKALDMLEGE